jgi:periplasmic glucans biosynthesis protein
LRPQTPTAITLVLVCLVPLLTASARAQSRLGAPLPQTSGGFSRADVERMAQELAKKPYEAPREAAKNWANLNYDQFRDVRVSQQAILQRGSRRRLEAHLLPVGWLFKNPVDIHIVDNGAVRQIAPSNTLFEFGPLVEQPKADTPPIEFSGFRLNGPINQPNVFDEIAVFQGASYFRAVSKGQVYGLSARGLAIDTAQPNGEEFPFFRSFWIETPVLSARQAIVHALLDSPSATGAYTFRIAGGKPTTMDVDVRLFARRGIQHMGLAPLTSMFLFSGNGRSRIDDFRPAVHDSDGLAIADARGERIWRPLANPLRLQVSAFSVKELAGFGLVQRRRSFSDFEDLEARYERRPSAWVEPKGSWGKGAVHLVEIPSEEEIHDNIVAFWQPGDPYRKDSDYSFGYRLLWPDDAPQPAAKAVVLKTLSGLAHGPERKNDAVRFAVDFGGAALRKLRGVPSAALSASAGNISEPIVEPNPATGGVRVNFTLTPGDADTIELRLELKGQGKQTVSEVWLWRWTK